MLDTKSRGREVRSEETLFSVRRGCYRRACFLLMAKRAQPAVLAVDALLPLTLLTVSSLDAWG